MANSIEAELLRKAELLMELRGYRKESVEADEEKVDIRASLQDSDEKILIRIMKLESIGEKVKNAKYDVEGEEVDKVVVFGNRFTKAAARHLREQGVEFFDADQHVVSDFNPRELYLKIRDSVDALCEAKCGRVPQSEAECSGFSEGLTECSFCGGEGTMEQSYKEQKCPICGGVGARKRHYSCIIRLISDNSDFHFKHGWVTLLRNDLTSLLKIQRFIKQVREKNQPIDLGYSIPSMSTSSTT